MILGCLLLGSSGCSMMVAGAAQPRMLDELADHDPEGAAAVMSEALKTPDGKLPDKVHAFTGLMLAERGAARLSNDDPAASATDLAAADEILDEKDLQLDSAMHHMLEPQSVSRAFHMGWAAALNFPYVPRMHERLMLNALGMIDELDLGDAENARVESRRLDVMTRFADRVAADSPALRTRALTGILAGFAFDQGDDESAASQAYREAQAATTVDLSPLEKKSDANASELLLVVAYGLVPHEKLPEEPQPMKGDPPKAHLSVLDGGSDGEETPTIEVDDAPHVGVAVLDLATVVKDDFAQAERESPGNVTPLSWSSLPARFVIARVPVSPGKHHVRLAVRGTEKSFDVTVVPGGFAASSLVVLR